MGEECACWFSVREVIPDLYWGFVLSFLVEQGVLPVRVGSGLRQRSFGSAQSCD